MKKDDAVEALEKAGLILGNIGIVVYDGDKGTVINQDPPVGSNRPAPAGHRPGTR